MSGIKIAAAVIWVVVAVAGLTAGVIVYLHGEKEDKE
jgi:hypothetical protein